MAGRRQTPRATSISPASTNTLYLDLVFLKFISDAFEEKRVSVLEDPEADPEDRDEYLAENVFWVPLRGALGVPPGERLSNPTSASCSTMRWRRSSATTRRLKGVLPKGLRRDPPSTSGAWAS